MSARAAIGQRPDHLNLASLHNKEWHVGLAAFDQHLPARNWTNQSVGSNPRDLRGTQHRNMSAAFAALVRGVEGVVTVNTSGALDRVKEID